MATRIDILKGKPEKAVMNIAIPIFVYLLISNSYNIVDGMWITGIGKDAIAAVGAVMPLYMIITGVGMGIGTGATTCYLWFISLFGANDGTAVFAAGNKLYGRHLYLCRALEFHFCLYDRNQQSTAWLS